MKTQDFAEVCVLNQTNFRKDVFTYRIPQKLTENIQPGFLVKVPFGKFVSLGFVLSLSSMSRYKTKEILDVVRPFPILTPYQIKLISRLGRHYYCPLPLVARHFNIKLYPKYINKHTSSTQQRLVLIPTPYFRTDRFKPDSLTFHHGLKSSQKASIWSLVYSGSLDTIIGTRSALFLPFQNLKEVTIYAAENSFYSAASAPNFHAIEVARILGDLFGAKLKVHYSKSFLKELDERKKLGLPPYTELLCLTPVNKSRKNPLKAQELLLSLRERMKQTKENVEMFKITKDNQNVEIYIKGDNLSRTLPECPKDWRVKVYYLNID